jgi:hypothetical protein
MTQPDAPVTISEERLHALADAILELRSSAAGYRAHYDVPQNLERAAGKEANEKVLQTWLRELRRSQGNDAAGDVRGELLLPFLDEMSKHANWCRKNVSDAANCTCPAEGAAHEAEHIRKHVAALSTPSASQDVQAQGEVRALRRALESIDDAFANTQYPDDASEGHFEEIRSIAKAALLQRQPSDAQEEQVFNVDALAWQSIKGAAAKSSWIPSQYCMQDWVSDVCEFLRRRPSEKQRDIGLDSLCRAIDEQCGFTSTQLSHPHEPKGEGDARALEMVDHLIAKFALNSDETTSYLRVIRSALSKGEGELRAALDEAATLLRGWRITYEMGRHENSPINSTCAFISKVDALLATQGKQS